MEAIFRICKDYMVYPKKNPILFKNPVCPKIWCNLICGTQCKDWGRRKKFTPYTSHSCRLSTLYMHSRMCQYSFGTYFEIPCIGYILNIKGLYEKGMMGGCRCEVLGAPTPARRQIICDVTSDVTQSNWGGGVRGEGKVEGLTRTLTRRFYLPRRSSFTNSLIYIYNMGQNRGGYTSREAL